MAALNRDVSCTSDQTVIHVSWDTPLGHFAFNHQAVVELADVSAIVTDTAPLLRVKVDLISSDVPCRPWIAQVATYDLVACHDNVCALVATIGIAAIALIVRDLIVRL